MGLVAGEVTRGVASHLINHARSHIRLLRWIEGVNMEDKRSSSKTNEEQSQSSPSPPPPPPSVPSPSGDPPVSPSMSPEETRYNDILAADPNNVERRFPVDRRKLERLIVGKTLEDCNPLMYEKCEVCFSQWDIINSFVAF